MEGEGILLEGAGFPAGEGLPLVERGLPWKERGFSWKVRVLLEEWAFP